MEKIPEAQLTQAEKIRQISKEMQHLRENRCTHPEIQPESVQAMFPGECKAPWV